MSKNNADDKKHAVPESLARSSRRRLLLMHGQNGYLIMRLQRYALLGWLLFALCALALAGFALLTTMRPQAVLAVDESGRLLGRFEYLDASARSDEELIASARRFCQRYFSLNSHSIFEDYSAALSMMEEQLMRRTIEAIKASSYLSLVRNAKTRSYVEFEGEPQLLSRKGLNALVRARGRILTLGENGMAQHKSFDVALSLRIVPRSRVLSSGVLIEAIHQSKRDTTG